MIFFLALLRLSCQLLMINTSASSGPQVTPKIISGSRDHEFRIVHQMTMQLKHALPDVRMESFKRLEPVRSCTTHASSYGLIRIGHRWCILRAPKPARSGTLR